MKYIGITEARQNLCAVVARVEHGERITITRQGKAVAQLAPARKILPPLAKFRRELGRDSTPAEVLLHAERSVE